MRPLVRIMHWYYTASRLPEYLAPALDLGIRLLLANVFFKSGLTKIQNWDATLYLFTEVYHVPLLAPELAAWFATGAELILPVLLVLGLFGRFAAAGLLILNIVAVISYYADLSPAGFNQHVSWGLLLAVLLCLSRGAWSADAWLQRRVGRDGSRSEVR